jgi:endonuclease G
VPLPKLDKTRKEQVAFKKGSSTKDVSYELKYQHFSIVMNSERRMAFFATVNIDGSNWIYINRKTGEPAEAEANEVWFEDPRISARFQCDQRFYEKQFPKHVFDRGHLVRRQDPSWGTEKSAAEANTDTFHFTNCVPQQWNFNQQSEYWQGIENYVLDNAKAEHKRVTVFTGPVFAEDDPDYRYAKVPMQFWKILIRVEKGKLLSTGFLAKQSSLIEQMPEKMGEQAVTQYQIQIKEIEKLTGLNFGVLRDVDTFGPVLQESVFSMRKIEKFDDISL